MNVIKLNAFNVGDEIVLRVEVEKRIEEVVLQLAVLRVHLANLNFQFV